MIFLLIFSGKSITKKYIYRIEGWPIYFFLWFDVWFRLNMLCKWERLGWILHTQASVASWLLWNGVWLFILLSSRLVNCWTQLTLCVIMVAQASVASWLLLNGVCFASCLLLYSILVWWIVGPNSLCVLSRLLRYSYFWMMFAWHADFYFTLF
jgi:hypothetical protein